MISRWFIIFSFCTLFAAFANAQDASFESLFSSGLQSYQTKAYDKARDQFHEALKSQPGNTAAMTNLALTYFQLGDKGSAIGWFRRALSIDPGHPEAKAGLQFVFSKLDIKEIPHRIENYEMLRTNILQNASLKTFLSVTALLILAAGWLLFGWLGARKRALQSSEVVPAFRPTTGFLILFSLIAVVFSGTKIYDGTIRRGTVIGGKVSAKSLPSESGVALFELHEGFEIVIQTTQDDWAQVTYPGGLTGWVPRKNLIPSEGDAG